MVVGVEVWFETEDRVESGCGRVEGARSSAEQQDMPTRICSTHCREEDGFSPDEVGLAVYSLTDKDSDDAL